MPRYSDALTLREARRQYFDENGFGDGGYDKEWVLVRLRPLPFAFPNTAQRVRSVRLHDLHHVATGYGTDMTGESEIGAWEIASSCRDHYAAWLLNLYAIAIGLFVAPRAIWRAFLRGRRSANLYGREFHGELLEERVGALRARLRLAGDTAPASLADAAAFAGWVAAGLAALVVTALLALSPLLAIAAALWRFSGN
jgi:hypothetical protein